MRSGRVEMLIQFRQKEKERENYIFMLVRNRKKFGCWEQEKNWLSIIVFRIEALGDGLVFDS